MHKKIIIFGLYIFSTFSLFSSNNIVPYENVIAREYNRIHGTRDRYSSIDKIMNQSLRGKSIEQKNLIIADLRSLKHAIYTAKEQAKYDGTRMWYFLYLYKDNEIAIDTLAQYNNDVAEKLAKLEWESCSDLHRASWYFSKYAATFIAGIVAVWASQGYLHKPNFKNKDGNLEYLTKNDQHDLFELLIAPAYASKDLATRIIKKAF